MGKALDKLSIDLDKQCKMIKKSLKSSKQDITMSKEQIGIYIYSAVMGNDLVDQVSDGVRDNTPLRELQAQKMRDLLDDIISKQR